MGQLLSIPMVLAGAAVIAYALKRKPIETRVHPKDDPKRKDGKTA